MVGFVHEGTLHETGVRPNWSICSTEHLCERTPIDIHLIVAFLNQRAWRPSRDPPSSRSSRRIRQRRRRLPCTGEYNASFTFSAAYQSQVLYDSVCIEIGAWSGHSMTFVSWLDCNSSHILAASGNAYLVAGWSLLLLSDSTTRLLLPSFSFSVAVRY